MPSPPHTEGQREIALMDQNPQPNLADPAFEPTDEQINDVLRSAARLARWQSAMADQGVKVLTLGLSDEEMCARARAWDREPTTDSR